MAPRSTSPAHTFQNNGEGDKIEDNGLWKIEDIPGKGKGIIVTQDIAPGTCLISEAPLITTEGISMHDADLTERQLLKALQRLPQSDQDRYRGLSNYHAESDPEHPLTGIVKSNGYPLGTNTEHGGVFADISRINHSCLPNTVQYWNPLHEKQVIHAVRAIPKDTEMTTSYTHGGTSEERKKFLKEVFGFGCACEICSLPEDKLRESDKRMAQIEKLDETLGDSKKVRYSPDEVMKSARAMFKLYDVEGVKDGRLSRLYYDAFQLCNMHSDLARARCFAKYYTDSKKMAEGKDSINVLEIMSYVKNPQKHDSFGSTEMWKTATSDVPKGLKANEFAKWLWRENL